MVSNGFRSSAKLLTDAKVIFWDFDGVIKNSASLKTQAYLDLVAEFGVDAQKKVLLDYGIAGGMSRFQLIPRFYKDILKVELTDEQLSQKIYSYSKMVVEGVILSAYIKGVKSYLDNNFNRQKFIIVTNTPKAEIDMILKKLDIARYFESVFGAPDLKEDVVKNTLNQCDINADDCVFVGDSSGDHKAAQMNGIKFIYRGSKYEKLYKYSLVDFLVANELSLSPTFPA